MAQPQSQPDPYPLAISRSALSEYVTWSCIDCIAGGGGSADTEGADTHALARPGHRVHIDQHTTTIVQAVDR